MKNYVFAAAAALSMALPSAASAATQVNLTGYTFANGSRDGVLHLSTSPFDNALVNIGQFKLTGTAIPSGVALTLFSYCIDLGHGFGVPAVFDIMPLSTLFTGTKAANLNKLLGNTSASTTDASAAIQMAIWEIANETTVALTVSSDNFFVTAGSSSAARTLANSYLTSLATWSVPTSGTAKLLISPGNQSQIFFELAPSVPEPETWGMLILGMGAVGTVMRRRKRAYVLA